MTDKPPEPPETFEERLRQARVERDAGKASQGGATAQGRIASGGGLGTALRTGVEFVSAIGVGVGIGLLLDYWLDSRPWFLVGFFVLGSVAGFLNVFRVMQGYGQAAGYRRSEDRAGERSENRDGENRNGRDD